MFDNRIVSIRILLTILLSILASFFVETYIILVENANIFNQFLSNDLLNLFLTYISVKHLMLFIPLFLIIFYILLNTNLRHKTTTFLFRYRVLIGIFVVAICVLFQLHGSSLFQLDISNSSHKALFGVSRSIRADEFNVFTPFAFSQYFNDFGYFSSIVRGVPTDMFIVYGQPIFDLLMVYRPFLVGYLFFDPSMGLSFFWVSRLVVLLLVSFEFGLLITNKNKVLSLSYAILLTFSGFVQWWFSINSLVEMLIFSQLFILLLNYYFNSSSYIKKFLITLFLVISLGGFILAFYPAWEIPLGYVLIFLIIWILYENKEKIMLLNKKDGLLVLMFLSLLSITFYYILTQSYDTILAVMNTSYPGSRVFLGEGRFLSFFVYISTIFYPITPDNISILGPNYSFIITFFPASLILFYLVQVHQKRHDKLLYLLFVVYLILICYYLLPIPEIIGKVSFLSKSFNERLLQIAFFVDLLMLIRGMSLFKKIGANKKIIFAGSLLVTMLCASLFIYARLSKFSSVILVLAVIILLIGFYIIFNSYSIKYQKVFLIMVIILSFVAGGLVNPIESGTDYYFNQPIIEETSAIVSQDPNATWIISGNIYIDEIIGVGAHTLNSVNTYPNFETWQKLDPNNESYEIYNRYAHIPIVLVNNQPTTFISGDAQEMFTLYLNTNDLEKLNITYVLSPNSLEQLNNENVTFTKVYEDNNLNKIFKILYL